MKDATVGHVGRATAMAMVAVALLATALHARADGPRPAGATPAMVVNINTATSAELEKLPGIGPSRARAILALRERLGRFRRVEQLLRVRGIGRRTFRRLRPLVTVDGPAEPEGGGT
jgi:competence protein ComEA